MHTSSALAAASQTCITDTALKTPYLNSICFSQDTPVARVCSKVHQQLQGLAGVTVVQVAAAQEPGQAERDGKERVA
eukprot:scaffold163887_cov13-Tisochrysis_lutea.AAC.1